MYVQIFCTGLALLLALSRIDCTQGYKLLRQRVTNGLAYLDHDMLRDTGDKPLDPSDYGEFERGVRVSAKERLDEELEQVAEVHQVRFSMGHLFCDILFADKTCLMDAGSDGWLFSERRGWPEVH